LVVSEVGVVWKIVGSVIWSTVGFFFLHVTVVDVIFSSTGKSYFFVIERIMNVHFSIEGSLIAVVFLPMLAVWSSVLISSTDVFIRLGVVLLVVWSSILVSSIVIFIGLRTLFGKVSFLLAFEANLWSIAFEILCLSFVGSLFLDHFLCVHIFVLILWLILVVHDLIILRTVLGDVTFFLTFVADFWTVWSLCVSLLFLTSLRLPIVCAFVRPRTISCHVSFLLTMSYFCFRSFVQSLDKWPGSPQL